MNRFVLRRGGKKDAREPECWIDRPQSIVEPSGVNLSTDTRRYGRYKVRVALALNFDGAPRLMRGGLVPERTSVSGPSKERTAPRWIERARGNRFLRGLCRKRGHQKGCAGGDGRTYLDDTRDLGVALAHVDDAEFPTHGERDDLVQVRPDVSDLLVRDTLVERPRRHVLLCAGVPCDASVGPNARKKWQRCAYTT